MEYAPCPNCGRIDGLRFEQYEGTSTVRIMCAHCDLWTHWAITLDKAKEQWNAGVFDEEMGTDEETI